MNNEVTLTFEKFAAIVVLKLVFLVVAFIGLYQIDFWILALGAFLTFEFTDTSEVEYYNGTKETFVSNYSVIRNEMIRDIVLGLFMSIGLVSFIYH